MNLILERDAFTYMYCYKRTSVKFKCLKRSLEYGLASLIGTLIQLFIVHGCIIIIESSKLGKPIPLKLEDEWRC